MAIYMKYGSAQGDVTESGHKQWIELLSCHWSMARTLRSAVGIGLNRESTSAFVSELSCMKLVDSGSSNLTQNAFVGEAQQCEIDFTRVEKGQEAVFRKITLTDAIISGLVNQGQGKERPTEVLTLNFTEIQITDVAMSAEGEASGQSTVTYNLQTAQTS